MASILIISPEPWDALFVSKHHYAIELARRGHRVLFYGPPDPSGPTYIENVQWQEVSLGIVHSPQLAKGLRFLPSILRWQIEAKWLKALESLEGKQIDVVWLFENSRFYDMRFAGDRLKIYHQVDLNQDFQPETAARTCNLAVAISRPIEDRLRPVARKLIRVTHGYADRSQSFLIEGLLSERFSDASIHALMTGNFNLRYLDIPLLTELVKRNPAARFHFIGTYTQDIGLHHALASEKNAIFWGKMPAEALPSIFERTDILLLAYLSDEYLQQLANPHKLMEYLASGKVVLATRTLEYEERPGLIQIAQNRVDFLDKFQRITNDISVWNTVERMDHRRAFAAGNTYAHQVDRIVAALGEQGSLIA